MSVKSSAGHVQRRWWTLSDKEIGSTVWSLATTLRNDQPEKGLRFKSNNDLYEGEMDNIPDYEELPYGLSLNWNVSRSACDTVHSEIAGRQKPMAKFQTSGGDWRQKRRAKKLEKFCEAELRRSHGCYLNVWEIQEGAFLDAAIQGVGITKVFWANGRICLEKHLDKELFVDPIDSRYGNPQSLFHIYIMDKDQAIHMFADDESLSLSNSEREDLRNIIESSDYDSTQDDNYNGKGYPSRAVQIVEAWHLPQPGGDGNDGKHVFCVDGGTLLVEGWTRRSFPFVRIRWAPHRIGWGAKGLVEEGESIQLEINENTTRLQERFRLCASKRTFVEDGSVEDEEMMANGAEVIVRVKKGAQFPVETVPKPLSDAELAWLNGQHEKYYSIIGVSEMRASARKETGVTAGVAIRTINDMQTARFSLKAKAYENSYVELARQMIECAKEAAVAGEEVPFDEEIDWQTLELPDNQVDISIAPASALPNDPAGRLQFAQDLYEMQLIQAETFKSLLGFPDLEKEMSSQTAQRNYIEKKIGIMLDAEEGDDELYESPDAHLLDKPGALVQVVQAYFEAMYDDAPEFNLEMLRRYISEIDGMIAEANQAAAAAQQVAQPETEQQA